MQILAIETVGTTGSVAALAGERVLAEQPLDPTRRSAQTLAPAIAMLLDAVGWRPGDVQLVAVATGPGSFTGLRIGATTAKAFAYAAGAEIIDVPTFAAIGFRIDPPAERFHVVLDALRGELFAGKWQREPGGGLREIAPAQIVAVDLWLASLAAGDVVTGPGLEHVVPRLPAGVVVVDRSRWNPTAAAVGQAGWSSYVAGHRANVFDLVPQYFRRAAAEEKRDKA